MLLLPQSVIPGEPDVEEDEPQEAPESTSMHLQWEMHQDKPINMQDRFKGRWVFVMLGAPMAGKTTFIKKHFSNTSHQIASADACRAIICGDLENQAVSPAAHFLCRAQYMAWIGAFTRLKKNMDLSEYFLRSSSYQDPTTYFLDSALSSILPQYVLVDNTNTYLQDIAFYQNMAQTTGLNTCLVEFCIPLEILLARKRERVVPPNVIQRLWDNHQNVHNQARGLEWDAIIEVTP
jgi:predicted kinase